MEFKSVNFSAADTEGRTFAGYASTFNNIDAVGDTIQAGAFAKSITERLPRNLIKVLWQHQDPIGLPRLMREDANGLYVEGVISKTRLGDEALELIRDGVVDKMSIGFTVEDYEPTDAGRLIKSVTLYEFSPVTFPADEYAGILGVKHRIEEIDGIESRRDIERILRQSGFSKSAATALYARIRNLSDQGEPEVTDVVRQLVEGRSLFAAKHILRK